MGRTIPSWRISLEEEFKRWKEFQSILRTEERTLFEDLMDECRRYASAAGAACFPLKFEGMFLSILFAHHKRLKELCNKIDHLNNLTERSSQANKQPSRTLHSTPGPTDT